MASPVEQIKEKLIEQKYKCALTGDNLTFDNMELDHILSPKRNGTNDLLNVRWVTKKANRLKQDLTDKELIILMQKILTNFKNKGIA